METKHTYVRELHSFFEGLAFIWIILCGLIFNLIDYLDVTLIALVIVYALCAFFSKIQSFAVECACAAWYFYIIAAVQLARKPGVVGHTGMVLVLGVIAATGIFMLIGSLYLALRKSKIYDEKAIAHTWYYKLYRFLRGAVFVVALLLFIFYLSLKFSGLHQVVVAMHWDESLVSASQQGFSEGLRKNLFTLTSTGAILMVLGYFTSVFALGIELLIAGFILLFLTLAPIIIYFIGPFSLMNGIIYIMGIPILYMALIALFCIAFKKYRKKHHV